MEGYLKGAFEPRNHHRPTRRTISLSIIPFHQILSLHRTATMMMLQVLSSIALFGAAALAGSFSSFGICYGSDYSLQYYGNYCGYYPTSIFTSYAEAKVTQQCFSSTGSVAPKLEPKTSSLSLTYYPQYNYPQYTSYGCYPICMRAYEDIQAEMRCPTGYYKKIVNINFRDVSLRGQQGEIFQADNVPACPRMYC